MTLWTAVVMAVVGATVPSAFAVCVILLLRALAKEQPSSGRRPGVLLSLMISACAGCAVWWIWLSWGGYYEDIYGQPQGPYRPWQVIACGITMVVLSIVMGLWSRWRYSGPFLVALGASWGFSVAWGIDAFAEDETGLSGVGFLMVLIGSGFGLMVVAAVTLAFSAAAQVLLKKRKAHGNSPNLGTYAPKNDEGHRSD